MFHKWSPHLNTARMFITGASSSAISQHIGHVPWASAFCPGCSMLWVHTKEALGCGRDNRTYVVAMVSIMLARSTCRSWGHNSSWGRGHRGGQALPHRLCPHPLLLHPHWGATVWEQSSPLWQKLYSRCIFWTELGFHLCKISIKVEHRQTVVYKLGHIELVLSLYYYL